VGRRRPLVVPGSGSVQPGDIAVRSARGVADHRDRGLLNQPVLPEG
jgi:hypothetical protein